MAKHMSESINPTEYHHTFEENSFSKYNEEELEYDDQYDRADNSAWGGRPWVKASAGQQADPKPLLEKHGGVRILSYNVFADCKCANVRYSTSKKWEVRCRTLIKEIASYNADIVCLQDVDHFGDWWRPQLMLIGYDSVYKKRTRKQNSHYEGVCIAYKRSQFQLFRSVGLELNKTTSINTSEMGAAFKDRLITDDVALICMLQPWQPLRKKKPPKEYSDKYSSLAPVVNPRLELEKRIAEKKAADRAAGLLEDEEDASEGRKEDSAGPGGANMGSDAGTAGLPGDSDSDNEGVEGASPLPLKAFKESLSANPAVKSTPIAALPESARYAIRKASKDAVAIREEYEKRMPKKAIETKGDSLEDFSGFDNASDDEGSYASSQYDSDEYDTCVQSALCVVSAQLSDRPQDTAVRYFQAQYILREVETANKEFHLPIVLGVSLFDSPISSAYHALKTGRSPIKPQAPRKIGAVRGEPTCRGTTKLTWRPPKTTKEDPPILKYRIAWRPGGSLTMGFRLQIEVDPVMCLAYGEYVDPKTGMRKTYQKEDLEYYIVGLSSDLPFEFIVCATNEIGEGIWSDPSMPVVMPNPKRAPPMPALKVFSDPLAVRELRERSKMQSEDWDVEVAISSNPVNSRTQLTPRLISGRKDLQVSSKRILPLSINPREGWNEQLGGGYDQDLLDSMMDPKILNTSILRRREEEPDAGTFLPEVSDSPRAKRALTVGESTRPYLVAEELQMDCTQGLWDDRSLASKSMESDSINFHGTFSPKKVDKILKMMVKKETDLQAAAFAAEEERIAASRQVVVEEVDEWAIDDEESEDGSIVNTGDVRPSGNDNRGVSAGDLHASNTEGKTPIGGLGDTESKPYIETDVTQTTTHDATVTLTSGAGESKDTLPPVNGATPIPDRRSNKANREDLTNALLQIHLDAANNDRRLDDSVSIMSGSTTMDSATISSSLNTQDREAQERAVKWQQAIVNQEEGKLEDMRIANLEGLRDLSRTASKLNDSTYLDGADLFKNIGTPHHRTLHNATLRSAYEQYSSAGEPQFTQSYPAEDGEVGVACTDYLFFSGDTLCATDVLACPELTSLMGDNPREPMAVADMLNMAPRNIFKGMFNREKAFEPKTGYGHKAASASSVQSAKKQMNELLQKSFCAFDDEIIDDENANKNALWGGIWAPFVAKNQQRKMHWLPNETFTSSHLALGAQLSFIKGNLVTNWR